MINSVYSSRRTYVAAIALLLVLGAGFGTAAIEMTKRAAWGPFGTAADTNHVSARLASNATQRNGAIVRTVSAAPSCSCGANAAWRSPFGPRRLSAAHMPAKVLRKPAGDCLQASVVDAPEAGLELAEVDVQHAARKLPGEFDGELEFPTPALLAVAVPAVTATAQGYANSQFADPMVAASFGGSSGFFGPDGPLSSMPASESFGDPVIFAATSNPGSGGSSVAVVVETPTVPEPMPLTLFALGLLSLAAARRRAVRVSR